MTGAGEAQPDQGRSNKPPKRNWEAARKERFFDLKFSHYVELILTAILVGVGYLQYKVYTRQAGIMERQVQISEADQRPWVSLTNPRITSVTFTPRTGTEIKFEALVQNTGHLPADAVIVDARTYIPWHPGKAEDPPGQVLDKMCPADPTPLPPLPKNSPPIGLETTTRGFVVFPGDKTPYEYSETIQPQTIDDMRTTNPNPAAYPFVVVCINYNFVFKTDRHQTGHIFAVYTLGPNGQHEAVPMTGEIPKDKIGVSQIQGTRAN